MPLAAVLFDLDGTLVDSAPDLAGARQDLGRYLELAPDAADADSIRERLIDTAGTRAALH